jgi:hypothetical protein
MVNLYQNVVEIYQEGTPAIERNKKNFTFGWSYCNSCFNLISCVAN